MSGHSKWSKVKHIKGVVDAKRGKLFSKWSKEITIAAKEGGGDPDLNPRLRQSINGAKAANMPNDNIERAIKKGTGELGGDALEEALYEGYAPGGVAMLIEAVTDNKNRTAAQIRSLFSKGNGSFAESGSVAYLFDRKGEIRIPSDAYSEDDILELAMEAGVEDVSHDGDDHVLTTAQDQLYAVATALKKLGAEPKSEQLVYIPKTTVEITEKGIASQVVRLYEALDDYDDTLNVYSNFEIDDDLASLLAGQENI